MERNPFPLQTPHEGKLEQLPQTITNDAIALDKTKMEPCMGRSLARVKWTKKSTDSDPTVLGDADDVTFRSIAA